MDKSIAVITRTKNRTFLLRRAIESVISQSYSNWVHVIVNDGGNSDEVKALVASYAAQYKGRLVLVHNEQSVGMEAASNIGIRSSVSDYIVIHDDDDSWAPNFLSEMIIYLTANQTLRGAVCWTTVINEEIVGLQAVEKSRLNFNGHLRHCISLVSLVRANQFPPISFLFERRVAEQIGFFDEALPVLGDWDFNVRFMNLFDIGVCEKHLCFYHLRPKVSGGSLGNSVIAGNDLHGKFNLILRNRYLRNGDSRYDNIRELAISIYSTEGIGCHGNKFVELLKKLMPTWFKNIVKKVIA